MSARVCAARPGIGADMGAPRARRDGRRGRLAAPSAGRCFIPAILIAAAGCGGTVTGGGHFSVGARTPVPEGRKQLLAATGDAVWRHDLPTAEATLARLADRESRSADPALDFWADLIALFRCEPLSRAPRDAAVSGDWDALRRLVQIERVRLPRRQTEQEAEAGVQQRGERGGSDPADRRSHRPTRSDLAARTDAESAAVGRPAAGPTEIAWPVETERWSDELPVAAAPSRCSPDSLTRLAPAGDREAAFVTAVAAGVPDDHPAAPLLIAQALVFAVSRHQEDGSRELVARLDRLVQALAPGEQREAVLAAAIVTLADKTTPPELVTARVKAALDMPAMGPDTRRALTFVLSERLAATQHAEEATAARGAPPHGDDAVGHYLAFRQAQAHARAGRRDLLFAEAREALQRHNRAQVQDDPALAAIMDMALRALLASPVSRETLELLESLGPPAERLVRAEAFAQMALASEAHASAMTTFLWLYDTETDPGRQLQHLARACVAAARAGDRPEFARTFHLLAGQEPPDTRGKQAREATKPKPRSDLSDGSFIAASDTDALRAQRRTTRSANWQRALLLVARDALTALVDSDDQADLGILVDTLKRHLDEAGRGPVDDQLTTLYRAASAHLKTGPRAYAQTIGAARRPILLGDVQVARSYRVPAPVVDLASAVHEMGTLVFVPRRGDDPSAGSVERWSPPLGSTLAPGGPS